MIKCLCGCGEQLEEFDKYNIRRKYLKGHSPNKGKSPTEKAKQKMSESHRGISLSKEHKENISKGMIGNTHLLGHIHSPTTKRKMSISHKGLRSGPDSNFWKGGISPLNKSIRSSLQYKNWIIHIFERDDFLCQECGNKGKKLNAHHIKPLHQLLEEYNIRCLEESFICDELWDINNGITLCEKCHKKINTRRKVIREHSKK